MESLDDRLLLAVKDSREVRTEGLVSGLTVRGSGFEDKLTDSTMVAARRKIKKIKQYSNKKIKIQTAT